MRYRNIVILTSMLLMWGCSDNESQQPDGTEQEETVNSITVMREAFTRSDGETVSYANISDDDEGISDPNNWRYNTPDNLLPGGDEDVFPEGSKLFIAQITPSRTPNFPTDWTESKKYDNLLVYKIDKNTSGDGSSWNSGYNFVPYYEGNDDATQKTKLDWKTVKTNGSLGNAFSFYAMYYPGGTPISTLKQQYSAWTIDEIKEQDIMGAYHSTPSLYSRMRFRLYHLMVYIRVTLYVPVVKVKYNEKGEAIGYSGFGRNAFDSSPAQGETNARPLVYITGADAAPTLNNKNIYFGFTVDWRANRSSDTEAPLVKGSGNLGNIAMHLHKDFSYVNKEGFCEGNVDKEWGMYLTDTEDSNSDVFEIDRSKFMDVPDDEDPIEKVRRYEFTALLPPQSLNGKSLLWLILATPGVNELPEGSSFQGSTQGTYKHFSFSAEDSKLPTNNGQITLAQGTLQHFYLYVPRTGNKTIVMKANVVPWKYTQTDMIVTEEEPNENKQE